MTTMKILARLLWLLPFNLSKKQSPYVSIYLPRSLFFNALAQFFGYSSSYYRPTLLKMIKKLMNCRPCTRNWRLLWNWRFRLTLSLLGGMSCFLEWLFYDFCGTSASCFKNGQMFHHIFLYHTIVSGFYNNFILLVQWGVKYLYESNI